ncbi:Aspartyl/Asparaginyl beta-hydroxylase [Pedobacter sp. ok626]|uniref:aspartyl/asparaginyl beta-hydroxylase domain-containing protein n=1 Tax=Pedobacter sp. ok626 TaxID=1761882 RepID=UPI000889BAFE|nr:aspartyl/asparaginyl beta-hydroxylase domain-containing protein [Pedobacter sp. ok626]SDL79187.1 Aspartyl/Asparaginyl beta-hydroxylase [Pedobacter sp. ok626]
MASSHIKFSVTYNVTQLHQELKHCLKMEWPLHFNNFDYQGDWRSISLRSASGAANDIYAHSGDIAYRDTPLMAETPYISSIVNSWKCEKESVRLLALSPGSIIKPHKDLGCSYTDGNFRIHIPILTNKDVLFTVDGHNLFLDEGACWYIDFSNTHSIKNNGTTNRVHLIMDCIKNDWTDHLFRDNGYQPATEEIENDYDEATKAMIIAELERMDTDVARALITKMKGQSE